MNVVDFAVFVFAGVIGVRGFKKGFVREGLEAASALGGVFVAFAVYQRLGLTVSAYTGLPPDVTGPVLFAVVAAFVTAAGFLAAAALSRSVADKGWLSAADRAGGLGFGIVKGLFYASLVLILLGQIPAALVTNLLDGSAFARAVFSVAPDVYRRVDALLIGG